MLGELIKDMSSKCADVKDGDYVRDGLLYCGKCNTRKQTYIDVLGKRYKVSCACKHEDEAWAARNAQKPRGVFTKATKRSFAEDDGTNPSVQAVKDYADGFKDLARDGGGLLLYGITGSGKTWACECMMNDLIGKGISVLMQNVPEMVQKADIDGKWLDQAKACKLLILDDLGAERATSYAREIVYSAVNSRYAAGKPVVVTTNLSLEQMVNAEDVESQRIYGRILEKCIPVDFGSKNRRIEGVL